MKKLLTGLLLTIIALVGNVQESKAQVVVEVRPVRHNVAVVRHARIRAHHIWITGHWNWNMRMNKYMWVDGTYARTRKGYSYREGQWVIVRGGYKWVPGVWIRV